MEIVAVVLGVAVVLVAMRFGMSLMQFSRDRKRADDLWRNFSAERIGDLGAVDTLTVLPLIDWNVRDVSLAHEPGVSWLVRAGETDVLMDVGVNMRKEEDSPLLRNMRALGVRLEDIPHLFITHLHMDHVGGMKAHKARTALPAAADIDLSHMTLYAPTDMQHETAPVHRVVRPEVLAPGVASEGPIGRAIFGMGLTQEQALVVNVAGKGLVLIVGCGHQGLKRIFERAEAVFAEPIYGLIGGLHFPVTGSRMKMMGLPMQKFIGTGKLPWRNVTRDDVREAIAYLRGRELGLVSISAHDSCDWTIDAFREAFPGAYVDLKVGVPISV